jgi:hypothetical protein
MCSLPASAADPVLLANHGVSPHTNDLNVSLVPGAMVLAIEPALSGKSTQATTRPNADAPVDPAFYEWSEIPWREVNVPP